MSHIVQIQCQVRDVEAARAACKRLGLEEPVHGTATLFSGQATGLLVRLPGWLYPAVLDLGTGQVQYDNYGGSWGDPKHFDAFLQSYAVEKVKLEARKKGQSVHEQTLPDGSVKLTVTVGGGW